MERIIANFPNAVKIVELIYVHAFIINIYLLICMPLSYRNRNNLKITRKTLGFLTISMQVMRMGLFTVEKSEIKKGIIMTRLSKYD